jgi:hypothetical protein
MELSSGLLKILDQVEVLPRRIILRTAERSATVPMVRGVWGAALHALDRAVYAEVFEGLGPVHTRTPKYVLRTAPPNPSGDPAIEWVLIGDAIRHDCILRAAWDVAEEMGLGSQRRPFKIRAMVLLRAIPTHTEKASDHLPWRLSHASWPLPAFPDRSPCRLRFPVPLRLIRAGRLIEQPTLPDLLVAGMRRVAPFVIPEQQAVLARFEPEVLAAGRKVPAKPWQGSRLDLVRYSGRQQRALDVHGVAGILELPEGASEAWPLLAAAQWLHLGKGTVMGMGQLIVEPL